MDELYSELKQKINTIIKSMYSKCIYYTDTNSETLNMNIVNSLNMMMEFQLEVSKQQTKLILDAINNANNKNDE